MDRLTANLIDQNLSMISSASAPGFCLSRHFGRLGPPPMTNLHRLPRIMASLVLTVSALSTAHAACDRSSVTGVYAYTETIRTPGEVAHSSGTVIFDGGGAMLIRAKIQSGGRGRLVSKATIYRVSPDCELTADILGSQVAEVQGSTIRWRYDAGIESVTGQANRTGSFDARARIELERVVAFQANLGNAVSRALADLQTYDRQCPPGGQGTYACNKVRAAEGVMSEACGWDTDYCKMIAYRNAKRSYETMSKPD